MGIRKWFDKQPLWLQIVLLVIPGVNWVTDLLLRWDLFLKTKKTLDLVLAIISSFFVGNLLGYVDLVFLLLTKKLLVED